jgi:hypothetical protein
MPVKGKIIGIFIFRVVANKNIQLLFLNSFKFYIYVNAASNILVSSCEKHFP